MQTIGFGGMIFVWQLGAAQVAGAVETTFDGVVGEIWMMNGNWRK